MHLSSDKLFFAQAQRSIETLRKMYKLWFNLLMPLGQVGIFPFSGDDFETMETSE